MRIALCGTHRTGKTTLLNELVTNPKSIIRNYTPMQSVVIKHMNRHGITPTTPLTMEQRLAVQFDILDEYAETMRATENFITDRSPIDMIAYTYTSVTNHLTSYEDAMFVEYVNMSIAVAKELDHIIYVPPVIPVAAAPMKYAATEAMVGLIDRLILGELKSTRLEYSHMPDHVVDLEARVNYVNLVLNKEL